MKDSAIFKQSDGFSLLETLLVLLLLGAGSMMLVKMTDRAVQKAHGSKTRADLKDLAVRLHSETNCLRSLAPYASSLATVCGVSAPASPVPAGIALYSKNGGMVLNVGHKQGRYSATAYCENYVESGVAKRGIAVYATIPDPDKPGAFQKELLTGQVFDRNHPSSRIVSAKEGLCREVLNATSFDCGVGGLVSEVKSDGSVVCAPNAAVCAQLGGAWSATKGRCFLRIAGGTCPPTQVLVGFNDNGKPECESPARNIRFYNAKSVGGNPGGGPSKTQACCSGSDKMIACSGARQVDVRDTCDEEQCGYIGAVIQGNCCTVGADTDSGTNPVANGLCVGR
jgi:hypothetical protein